MYFAIADEHYHHKNIIKLQNRPFKSLDEMHKTLINNHNKVVGHGDITIHAGDFCWLNDLDSAIELLKQLKGNHFMLKGNHDKNWFQKLARAKEITIENYFGKKAIVRAVEPIFRVKKYYTICHYPMLSWPGKVHLYGHTHDNRHDSEFRRSISAEVINYTPVRLPIPLIDIKELDLAFAERR